MVLADSPSDSSSSIGAVVGFVFRLAGGSSAESETSRGSHRAGGALLGAGRVGSWDGGGGPCSGGRVPKADAGCRNRLCCGDACVIPCDWFNNSWNRGVCVKAACLLTDSIYSLAVSDRGGTEKEVLGLRFAGMGETAGGDKTTGAGSVGRGGVSEVSIGTGS